MRQLIYLFIFLVTVSGCTSETKQAKALNALVMPVKACIPGEDTINLITAFTQDIVKTTTHRFISIVHFISDKGLFKPNRNIAGTLKIERKKSKTFPVAYDTCDMKRWIKKSFITENLQVTKVGFTGMKKDRFAGFTPGLHFEEWKFANNKDRDSAMKIVQTAYTYPNNIVMYEKRYSQFILDDKRIFLLETGAKFAEPYGIQYKKLIEQLLDWRFGMNQVHYF